MADIEMCEGTNCPLREQCYRYIAPVNDFWQAYSDRVPYDIESGECEDFWDIKE